MSPRGPHLRNRKKIKTPKRFEDVDYLTSPVQQESREESEESSGLEEETYDSPKPKKPRAKRSAYRGEVTEFNPNLPPAAFPTLDHPDYAHNGGKIAIDLNSHSSELQSRNSDSWGHPEEIDLPEDLPAMTSNTTDLKRRGSPCVTQTSVAVEKPPHSRTLSDMYGESTDHGPRNPIWVSNMALMEQAGRMSDSDRIMLEMESSDEEDAAAILARTARISESPAWDDLNIAHKLDLADAIAELYPDVSQVMHQLRLNDAQKDRLVELLVQRQDRVAREEANQQRLQEQTNDVLLQGTHLSQSAFHQMVEEGLYEVNNENDHLQTNLVELKKARAYLRYCGFDPALADSSWNVPSISNAANGTKARDAQSKPKAGISHIAAQTSSSPSEGPLFASSQEASCPPDSRAELEQQHKLSQHRPTPAHALIAQHSPAAPLSKVPIQSYRVNAGNSGRMCVPQSSLSALQEQLNVSKSAHRRAINNALLKASGPSNPREEHSWFMGSHPPAAKGLPTARRNHQRQNGANTNAGVSGLQGDGGIENGDLVNKEMEAECDSRGL